MRFAPAVQRELEKLRDAGSIGAPLEAELDVYCLPETYARHAALGDEVRFLTITSAARVHEVDAAPADAVVADTGSGVIAGVWLRVAPSRPPSACAAGTCGRTWVATWNTRSCAHAAPETYWDCRKPGVSPN